ncbi:MAG: NUDIX hydrolase [Acidimicrobiia bacterium]
MQSFRVTDARTQYDAGFFAVEQLDVVAPDGSAFTREVVRHCGAVVVVPVTDDRNVICVRQYRAALDTNVLEVVAGRRDIPGEAPIDAAQRELAEEIQMRAGQLIKLCEFASGPGFTDEILIVYLGLDLVPAPGAEPDGHEEVAMTIEPIPLDSLHERVARGEIRDAKTIIGMSLAQAYLQGNFPGME